MTWQNSPIDWNFIGCLIMGQKTEVIKFNLRDRGRKYTGQDRSNVDIQAWVDVINSPFTQELIANGDHYGYLGHELRAMYGMNVPDSIIDPKTGKTLEVYPATRTVLLKAYPDGTVEHQQEFLETPEGEYAKRHYLAKIGGFSAATSFLPGTNPIKPTAVHGFDYVKSANFATNKGTGVLMDALLDSAVTEDQKAVMLDSVINTYQNVYSDNMNDAIVVAQAGLLEQKELELQQMREKLKTRRKAIKEKQAAMLDSVICPTEDFQAYLDSANAFLQGKTQLIKEETEKAKSKPVVKFFGGLFG